MPVMEEVDQAGQHAQVESRVMAITLRRKDQVERQCAGAWKFFESLHKNPAMRALGVAIPMSLALWAMIGVLLWAMIR